MIQKSNVYEAIQHTIQKIKLVSQIKNDETQKGLNELKKACDNNTIIKAEDVSNYDTYIESIDAEKELCKSLHLQIDTLQKDYVAGRINHARFIDYLRPVKNFLNEKWEYYPTHLKKEKIEQVINQYL